MNVVDAMEKLNPTPPNSHDIAVTLNRLPRMDLPELRQLHRQAFGEELATTNTNHVRRKLAWHIQSTAEGGLPDSARQHALAIARDVDLRVRVEGNLIRRRGGLPPDQTVTTAVIPINDPRLPLPGTLLLKEFKGRTLTVKVLEDGFEYDGRHFKSLSAVAQEIAGTKWNGYTFFGLTNHDRRNNKIAR